MGECDGETDAGGAVPGALVKDTAVEKFRAFPVLLHHGERCLDQSEPWFSGELPADLSEERLGGRFRDRQGGGLGFGGSGDGVFEGAFEWCGSGRSGWSGDIPGGGTHEIEQGGRSDWLRLSTPIGWEHGKGGRCGMKEGISPCGFENGACLVTDQVAEGVGGGLRRMRSQGVAGVGEALVCDWKAQLVCVEGDDGIVGVELIGFFDPERCEIGAIEVCENAGEVVEHPRKIGVHREQVGVGQLCSQVACGPLLKKGPPDLEVLLVHGLRIEVFKAECGLIEQAVDGKGERPMIGGHGLWAGEEVQLLETFQVGLGGGSTVDPIELLPEQSILSCIARPPQVDQVGGESVGPTDETDEIADGAQVADRMSLGGEADTDEADGRLSGGDGCAIKAWQVQDGG